MMPILVKGDDVRSGRKTKLLMEPKICTKMLKKLSEKLRAKFPATTRGYSVVKIIEKPKDVGHFFEKFLKF